MARLITIAGKNKEKRIKRQAKKLRAKGLKVYLADNGRFFSRTTPNFRRALDDIYDVIIHIDVSTDAVEPPAEHLQHKNIFIKWLGFVPLPNLLG